MVSLIRLSSYPVIGTTDGCYRLAWKYNTVSSAVYLSPLNYYFTVQEHRRRYITNRVEAVVEGKIPILNLPPAKERVAFVA